MVPAWALEFPRVLQDPLYASDATNPATWLQTVRSIVSAHLRTLPEVMVGEITVLPRTDVIGIIVIAVPPGTSVTVTITAVTRRVPILRPIARQSVDPVVAPRLKPALSIVDIEIPLCPKMSVNAVIEMAYAWYVGRAATWLPTAPCGAPEIPVVPSLIMPCPALAILQMAHACQRVRPVCNPKSSEAHGLAPPGTSHARPVLRRGPTHAPSAILPEASNMIACTRPAPALLCAVLRGTTYLRPRFLALMNLVPISIGTRTPRPPGRGLAPSDEAKRPRGWLGPPRVPLALWLCKYPSLGDKLPSGM